MKGILPVVVLISLCAFLASCIEQAPAELSIIAKLDGKPQPVTCQLYNSKGNQISEMSTDFNGIGYFRAVPPGTYTVKFCDNKYTFYPAVKTVTLQSDDSLPVQIELSSPTGDAPTDGSNPPV
jgi:hypothetical protein